MVKVMKRVLNILTPLPTVDIDYGSGYTKALDCSRLGMSKEDQERSCADGEELPDPDLLLITTGNKDNVSELNDLNPKNLHGNVRATSRIQVELQSEST